MLIQTMDAVTEGRPNGAKEAGMKFTVTMKDPDVLQDAIEDAVRETLVGIMDEDEQAAIRKVRCEKVAEIADKWFKYGEYLSVEIDTDKETITVLEAE